ncbi:sugar ABC transporter substrate-binding protein [Subtercola frigoramans]|uniref:Ribose transport system substrate-binding protein n=1 Tax=Subtercola frigoramans TaxID=120298 RepID=A0ABS2L6Y8_9MICO|nr:substrate-binding domain-containing protein [Subtercola frigoramans]MBM7472871.1 ribose transport system substrate-binding protein [Subtercola frigoramans]
MTFFSRSKHKPLMAMGVMLATGLLLVGCSDDTGSGTSSTAASAADPNHVYAQGIPTLTELYNSNETAPPATGPKLPANKNVIFLSCGQAAPGCSGIPNAMATVAQKVGWKFQIIDGAFNANGAYGTGMRQAIAAKPDAIVVSGIGCAEIAQPLAEAKAAGIPVFNIQGADCDDPKNDGGASAPLFVDMQFNSAFATSGQYFYEWGFLQASYAIDATEGNAKILRTGYTGSIYGEYQKEGQDAALAKCSGCNVLSTVDWVATDLGAGGPLQQKFTTVLNQYPDANAALLNFDSVATTGGVAKAISDADRQGGMTVVAGEGFAPALQLIRDGGGLNADPAQSASWTAWGGIDAMNRYFNNVPQVPEGIGFRFVDVDHNMMPDGQDFESPIDYQTTYLTSWGLQ